MLLMPIWYMRIVLLGLTLRMDEVSLSSIETPTLRKFKLIISKYSTSCMNYIGIRKGNTN